MARALAIPGTVRDSPGCVARTGLTASLGLSWMSSSPHTTCRVVSSVHSWRKTLNLEWEERLAQRAPLLLPLGRSLPGKPREKGLRRLKDSDLQGPYAVQVVVGGGG